MKSRAIKFVVVSATASLLALGAAACGSSGDSDDSSGSQPVATTQAGKSTSVDVSLVEMAIDPKPTSVNAGSVTFDVTNNGQVMHEMVVIKTDTKAGDLPTNSAGEASEKGAIGEVADLASGQSKTLTLDMSAGHYALICNLPGHYAAGMYADFTVK